MTSVISHQHAVQASVLFVLALAGALMVGCRPRTSEQPPPATTTPPDTTATFEAETPVEEGPPEPERGPEHREGAPREVEEIPGQAEGVPGEVGGTPREAERGPGEAVKAPGGMEGAPGEAEQPAAEGEGGRGDAQRAPAEGSPAEKGPGEGAAEEEKFDPSGAPTVAWLPEPVATPDAEAKQEAEMKPYTEKIPRTDVTFDMVPIRGGKFMMGSPDGEQHRNDDEGPQHEVVIEPFWMGKCEVTWDEYELWGLGLDQQRREFTGVKSTARDELCDSIAQPTKPYSDMTFSMGRSGYPAICMTQLAARMYCKWLSAKTGRFYRLPTEAEWEYACRAGTKTAYSFGDDPDKLGDYAWYFDNADDKYHKVGQKKPNPWGLHDMHGNVSEWVLDQYIPGYYQQFAGKTTIRPLAVPTTLDPRAARGGCWDDDPEKLRSAARTASSEDWKLQDPQIPKSIWYNTEVFCPGFRVVRPLRVPGVEEAKLYEPDYQAVKEYKEAQAGKE